MSHLNINGVDKPLDHVYVNTGSVVKEAWEARDKNDHLLWGRVDTFTGTNSISARCYGLPVKSWEIDGNSQQSGVPSPDNIIMPNFCGVRTENLFDKDNFIDGGGFYPVGSSSSLVASANTDILLIPCKPSTQYTVSRYEITKRFMICFTETADLEAGTPIYNLTGAAGYDPAQAYELSAQSGADSKYLLIYYAKHAGPDSSTTEEIQSCLNTLMVVEGSTAPDSYIPYGYKISLTSAGQTVHVYLGQVQTLRRVKKLGLTGDESWSADGGGDTLFYYINLNPYGSPNTTAGSLCSHLVYGSRYTEGQYDIGETGALRVSAKGFASLAAFKQWLTDQYAAGTPVTVWYVLATPQTAIVNEPLARIGTYADTLTSDQAGVILPTNDGNTTISVDTSLAPSKFEIKVHAKPIHYGFKINKSVSDPSNAVIYTHDAVTMTPAGMDFTNGVFDYGSWENVWFIKNARPVMLNFDGTEAYDLDPNDYSKKLDGTPSDIADSTKNMNAMIAFPTVWIKRTDDASYNYIEISDRQLDSDFHAYAHEDASGVVKPYIYLPIYKGSLVDDKLRSISGVKPQSGTTAQQEVDATSALGTGWQIWDYTSKEMLCDLLTLISKSLDTQGKFGQGHSTGGSSATDFLDCGTLNDKGRFFGYSNTTSQVKCFGMEALWAERWDRELGLILDAGIYKIKEHPTYNITGEGYTAISTSVAKCPTSNNYIKTEVSTQFGSLPTVVGGTQSTYYCDYFYQNQSGVRVAIRGGYCDNDAYSGLRYVNVYTAASLSAWHIGASPVYKPI